MYPVQTDAGELYMAVNRADMEITLKILTDVIKIPHLSLMKPETNVSSYGKPLKS